MSNILVLALQDILRLLTLWFAHGGSPAAMAALQEGFGLVSIDTWLVVIPQVSSSCPQPTCGWILIRVMVWNTLKDRAAAE